MKSELILRSRSKHVYRVELTDQEKVWSHRRIITAVDRRGDLTEEQWQSIQGGDHPGHFGGNVEQIDFELGIFKVTVYVD